MNTVDKIQRANRSFPLMSGPIVSDETLEYIETLQADAVSRDLPEIDQALLSVAISDMAKELLAFRRASRRPEPTLGGISV